MPELIILIVALVLLILVVVWGHFLSSKNVSLSSDEHLRDDANIQLYHEHKAEIEKDFQQGRLDEENYQYLLAELDKSLLQDMAVTETSSIESMSKAYSFKVIWPITLSLFVLVFSFTLYSYSGAYEQLIQPQFSNESSSPQPHERDIDESKVAALRALKTVTENEPENSNAWYSLGQAFVEMGEYEKALESFDKVLNIEGEKADIRGAQAQALYYANNQKITPEVQTYIDKALSLNPQDASTNILLGMHNFMQEDYQKAINHWQLVIDASKQNVNVTALNQAIAEAKNRLSLKGKEGIASASSESSGIETENKIKSDSPQLNLSIELSDEILEKLSQGEDKTVFVYAVPANGTRMPVAALKIRASDLPTEVILDNTRAMSPQANLSSVSAVNIYAVVSNQGSVGMKSGDYKAEKLNVDVNTQTLISLTIDTIIP